MKRILFFSLSVLIFQGAHGALPPPASVHRNILAGSGVLQGGQAGRGFSLLDVKSVASIAKKTERVVIDVGDPQMQKLRGSLGYYNVELKDNRKLVISFSQTLNTKFTERDLETKFKKSLFVQSSKMYFDPLGQSMVVEMNLKKPALVRVLAVRGAKETGKLVFDLAESSKR